MSPLILNASNKDSKGLEQSGGCQPKFQQISKLAASFTFGCLLGLFPCPDDGGDVPPKRVDFHRTAQRYIPEDKTITIREYSNYAGRKKRNDTVLTPNAPMRSTVQFLPTAKANLTCLIPVMYTFLQ